MSLITSKIDCSDIKFDYMRYEITFTIQKSTMRRVKGYEAKATYYYEVMKSVFWDFFKKYPEIVNNINRYTGIYLTDPSVLDNICQVQCIGDKVVVIKL
jgi:hypothetical protein